MTNEKRMKNYERRPLLELPRSFLVGTWSFCASSFRNILAHQLFLLGALISFLTADQALVIKID